MKLKALDKEKLMLRIGLRALHSLYKSAAEIRADVEASGEPIVHELHLYLEATAHGIRPASQRAIFQEAGEFALWMLARDSAYRDPLLDLLANVVTSAAIKTALVGMYRRPAEWYINQAPHMTKEELTHEEEFKRYVTSRISEQEQARK